MKGYVVDEIGLCILRAIGPGATLNIIAQRLKRNGVHVSSVGIIRSSLERLRQEGLVRLDIETHEWTICRAEVVRFIKECRQRLADIETGEFYRVMTGGYIG